MDSNKVKKSYQGKYRKYGVDPRSLFWVRRGAAHQRFRQIWAEIDFNGKSVLDVGCAKGFMLHDFMKVIPGIKVAGVDISEYAIDNAMEDVEPYVMIGNAKKLPFLDNSFDLVISITTVHNLHLKECKMALREIQRVSRKNAFITVDSWRNEIEQDRLAKWVLTGYTMMSTGNWKKLFEEVGYTGDYYWFIA